MAFSQDYKCFVHVVKYKKKYIAQKDSLGERIKISYKNGFASFEEDFEYYDYEISIGQVALGESQHMIHVNEEKNPLRKTHQLLT